VVVSAEAADTLMIVTGSTDSSPAGARRPSFARSAAQTWGTQVIAAFLSLGNVLIVARVLGPEGRGSVALLTAMAWLSASLATLGVQEANSNLAAAEPATRPALATNSALFSLILGGCTIVLLAGLIAAFPAVAGDTDPTLRRITFACLPLIIFQFLLRFLVQADYGFAVSNAAYLLAPIINVVVNGLFAVFGVLSVGSAVGVWLAGQGLEVVILAWYVQQRLAGFGRPSLELALRALGFGLKAHVGRIMQIGNYRLDQWLLGAISGSRELGLYSVAVAWAEALWYLPTALSYVQRPDLVRATAEEARRRAAKVFRAAMVVTGASAVVMILAAPVLCVVIFGSEFRGSIDDLRVLVAGAFGMAALKLLGNALVARGRPGLQSAAIGAGFLLTVGLDILLIPPLGGLGAALASTLAYTAAGIVVAIIFVRALHVPPRDLVPRVGDVRWLWGLLRRRLTRTPAPPPEETPIAPLEETV
jgi:O-antigen/teichoic acid export membrane protein